MSLSAVQYYCNKRNYKLYVVAQYYDFAKTDPQNTNPLSLFSVNHKYYKADYCNKYMRLFTKDITRGAITKDESYKRYLFFKKDQWIFSKNRLDEKPGV